MDDRIQLKDLEVGMYIYRGNDSGLEIAEIYDDYILAYDSLEKLVRIDIGTVLREYSIEVK